MQVVVGSLRWRDSDPPRTLPAYPLRWLYSWAVRPAMSCMLSAITFGPVSLTSKMNVIGCDHVVQYGQTEALPRLENPMQVTAPITCKFLVEFLLLMIARPSEVLFLNCCLVPHASCLFDGARRNLA